MSERILVHCPRLVEVTFQVLKRAKVVDKTRFCLA